jgi:hypothetical protein
MFKQMISDFAFNRAIEKQRKISKLGYAQNSVVIASLLQTESLNWYSGVRAQKLRSFLTECVNRAKTQEGTTFEANELEEFICFVFASVHSMSENDTDENFYKEEANNQIKVLFNLKLLPERFLQLDIRTPEECVA